MQSEGHKIIIGLAAAATAAALFLALGVFRYVLAGGYFDHIEPTISIAAWRFLEGSSLYQRQGDWPIFGTFYGPMIYLAHAAMLAIAGGSIVASKLANALALGGGLLLFYLYARRRFGAPYCHAGALMFIAFMLLFAPYSLWVRLDPFIIFLVALALFARDLPSGKVGRLTPHLVIGACIGLAVNFRAYAFIFFLPVMIDLCGWRNIRLLAIIVLFSLAVFLAPFAFDRISLINYLAALAEQVGGRSSEPGLMLIALRYLLLYLTPGVLLFGLLLRGKSQVNRQDAVYFAVFCASVLFAFYPASFSGAGPYHFLPLVPVAIDLMLRFSRGFADRPIAHVASLTLLPLILLVMSIPAQRRLDRNLDRMEAETAMEEAQAVSNRLSGETLQMGYGQSFESYRYTFVKPVLAFAGRPVTVDAHVINELSSVGVNIMPRLIEEFSSCLTKHWLIPKGEPPFQQLNYFNNKPLFGEAAKVFEQRYEKTETLNYFDLWSCKNH